MLHGSETRKCVRACRTLLFLNLHICRNYNQTPFPTGIKVQAEVFCGWQLWPEPSHTNPCVGLLVQAGILLALCRLSGAEPSPQLTLGYSGRCFPSVSVQYQWSSSEPCGYQASLRRGGICAHPALAVPQFTSAVTSACPLPSEHPVPVPGGGWRSRRRKCQPARASHH